MLLDSGQDCPRSEDRQIDMDQVLKMLPGNVIVVAGWPSMGKTALTLGITLANAASGRPAVVHSMKMGKTEVNNRILAARSRPAPPHGRRPGPPGRRLDAHAVPPPRPGVSGRVGSSRP
ncbi:DnaB helicase C-terminal domain-containing protein [Streptomyces sp. NBC_01604]|uniref:DnaB-like helicase C-terminal domain-containing protein n=1 Tax=Streptomyces sp. NBC_01604 TaxID=2975894 RepID=UPI003864A3DF